MKIAEAYGIKAVTISSYDELENYSEWLDDNQPCLINIDMPSNTKLIPKIQWKTMDILPPINPEIVRKVKDILGE